MVGPQVRHAPEAKQLFSCGLDPKHSRILVPMSPDLSTETRHICWTSSWSDILSEHVNITNIHLVDPLNKVIAFDEVERNPNFVA